MIILFALHLMQAVPTRFKLFGQLHFVKHRPPNTFYTYLTLEFSEPPATSFEVSDIRQLEGRVDIRNKQEALDFVRLKTSPVTRWQFASELEVIPSKDFRTETYSDVWQIDPWERDARDPAFQPNDSMAGLWGFAPDQWVKFYGLSKPKCLSTPKGYVIERWIADMNGGESTTLRLTRETVTQRGHYSEVTVKVLHQSTRMPMHIWVMLKQ